jgi:hypothetical protein
MQTYAMLGGVVKQGKVFQGTHGVCRRGAGELSQRPLRTAATAATSQQQRQPRELALQTYAMLGGVVKQGKVFQRSR